MADDATSEADFRAKFAEGERNRRRRGILAAMDISDLRSAAKDTSIEPQSLYLLTATELRAALVEPANWSDAEDKIFTFLDGARA